MTNRAIDHRIDSDARRRWWRAVVAEQKKCGAAPIGTVFIRLHHEMSDIVFPVRSTVQMGGLLETIP